MYLVIYQNLAFHSPLQTLTESFQAFDDNPVNNQDSPLAFWMNLFEKIMLDGNEYIMSMLELYVDQCLTITEVNIQKTFTE